MSAPVTHPNDDFLGATIAAHEGKQSPPPAPPHPGTTMSGLDVSHHQGTVNWGSVAAAGASFAYLKATEGTTFVDGQFSRNFAGSYAAGLFRGAYHFALPDRSSGAAQANFFVDHGGDWEVNSATLPPVADMEYNPYGPTCYGLDQAQMSAWVADFSTTVHNRTHRWPMIYTTKDWWSTCVGAAPAVAHNDPLWLARYNSSPGALPAGWSFYTVWQYDDTGIYPGDQDAFSGSINELRTFARSEAPVALRNPPTDGTDSVPSRPPTGQPPAAPIPLASTSRVPTSPAPTPTTTPPVTSLSPTTTASPPPPSPTTAASPPPPSPTTTTPPPPPSPTTTASSPSPSSSPSTEAPSVTTTAAPSTTTAGP